MSFFFCFFPTFNLDILLNFMCCFPAQTDRTLDTAKTIILNTKYVTNAEDILVDLSGKLDKASSLCYMLQNAANYFNFQIFIIYKYSYDKCR
jgi:hypothetical protein